MVCGNFFTEGAQERYFCSDLNRNDGLQLNREDGIHPIGFSNRFMKSLHAKTLTPILKKVSLILLFRFYSV